LDPGKEFYLPKVRDFTPGRNFREGPFLREGQGWEGFWEWAFL